MVRVLCVLFFGVYALTMSGQNGGEEIAFSDFVLWIGEKHKVKVSYVDDPSTFPTFSLDTSITLKGCLTYLEEEGDIEYFINDDREIFIRKSRVSDSEDQYSIIHIDIKDSESAAPVELVAVSIPGTIYGAYSDAAGHVVLTLPSEYLSNYISVSMVGYRAMNFPISGSTTEYEVVLEKEAIDFEDILIADRRDLISASKYGRNLIRSMPSIANPSSLLGGDVLREIQLLPGVAAHREDDAGISIRGSESEQTLILVDEIPIYNASHYFGIFGAINPLYTSSAELYKNNLPITYGEKNGGLLQISSKAPQEITTTAVSADLNLLTSAVAVNGRVSDKWTYNLAGRTTYRNVSSSGFSSLADEMIGSNPPQNFVDNRESQFNNSTPDFRFYDVNANVTFEPTSTTSIAAHVYTGSDDLSNRFENNLVVERQRRPVKLLGISQQDENWSNKGLSILAEYRMEGSNRVNSELYMTDYSMTDLNSISLEQDRNNGKELFNQKSETYNSIREVGFKNYLTLDVTKRAAIQSGLDLRSYQSILESDDIINRRLDINTSSEALSMFFNVDYDLGDQWQLNAGVRGTYYGATKKLYWSPRFDISKRVSDALLLKGSLGRQFQLSNLLSFEDLSSRNLEVWTISNGKEVPVSDLKHVMIGGAWKKSRWLVDVEFYHRYTRGLVEVASNNLQLSRDGGVPMLNQDTYTLYRGNGTTNGVDLLLSYTGKRGSTSLSYTLSKATHQFARINNGEAYPSYLDSRHQIQWGNTRKVGKWSVGLNLIFATGRTYSDLNKVGNDNTREALNPINRLSRLPDYYRVDAGIGYDIPLGPVNSTLSALLINLTDRQNVSYIQYTFSLPNQNDGPQRGAVLGNASNLLSRTLNLSWQIKF